jgi:hypothetical protein
MLRCCCHATGTVLQKYAHEAEITYLGLPIVPNENVTLEGCQYDLVHRIRLPVSSHRELLVDSSHASTRHPLVPRPTNTPLPVNARRF